MSGAVLWVALVLCGIFVVASFRYLGRRKLISRRKPEEIIAIHARVSEEVSLNALRDVMQAVGRAYVIDPKLIRPEDSLQKIAAVDSWSLDGGTERLNQWLISNGLSEQPQYVKTVLELARIVEEARGSRRGSESQQSNLS